MSITEYLKDVARIPNTFSEVVLIVYNKFTGYPEPSVCGAEEVIFLTWTMGNRYVDVEIYPNGHCEFFYLDKTTGDTFEVDFEAEDELCEDIIYYMNLLTKI